MTGPKIRQRIKGQAATTEAEAIKVKTDKKSPGRPRKGTPLDPTKKKVFYIYMSLLQALQEEADNEYGGNASACLNVILRQRFSQKGK